MSKYIFASVLVTVAAFASLSSATPVTFQGWNELLNADSLFSEEINFRTSKSDNAAHVLDEFKTVLEQNKNQIYTQFKIQNNNRPAASYAEKNRLEIFRDGLIYIAEHNLRAKQGKSSFEMGVNQFADMSFEEFNGSLGYTSIENMDSLSVANLTAGAAPESLDYRDANILTPIKDQSSCGACQAFTSTAQLESVVALKKHIPPVELSPQEMVDCARPNREENTCKKGLNPVTTSKYMKESGVASMADYPYEGKKGPCRNTVPRAAHIADYGMIDRTENALKEAVASYGPIAVAISVSPDFKAYEKGIFDEDCGNALRHGVLLIGYGSEGGKDFWIVKNSWAERWGEKGFGKIIRNTGGEGHCLIAKQAFWVTPV